MITSSPVGPARTVHTSSGRIVRGYEVPPGHRQTQDEALTTGRPVRSRTVDADGGAVCYGWDGRQVLGPAPMGGVQPAVAERYRVVVEDVPVLADALVARAALAGVEQGPAELLPIVGAHLGRVWWRGDDPVVLRRNERWSWAAPGATYDEIRHAPTCDTELEALAALLDWLDRPEDRRPDWLAGRRPDYLQRRNWRS